MKSIFILLHNIEHWIDVHSMDLTILAGGLTGALWKSNFIRICHDLFTVGRVEGAIVIALKALIGATVAYVFKTVCNHFTRKRKRNLKNQNKRNG